MSDTNKTILLEAMYSHPEEPEGVMIVTESMVDHEALLAHMYDPEGEEEQEPDQPKVERPYGIMSMPAMSAEIRKMREALETQERMIKRLTQRIRNMERQSNTIARHVKDLDSEIETKVDRSFR